MRTIVWIAAVFLIAASASAGEVFGTLSESGKPLPQGVPVKLECGSATTAPAVATTTDSFGAYSLKTSATGDCRLTVTYKGSSASLKTTLYEKPSRYDLVVKEEGGKITLSRK